MTKAFRATFEDVLSAQEELLHKLDCLIYENPCIQNNEDRDAFFKLLGHATLGLGWQQQFIFRDGAKEIRWPNVDFACRMLAAISMQKSELSKLSEAIPSPGNYRCASDEEMFDKDTMRKIWLAIRNHLFIIFPKAQDRASTISPERVPIERMRPTYVGGFRK